MSKSSTSGGKFLPALCSITGTLILILVILSAIPVSIPKLKGYEIYNIVSGSMEPAIPIGSAIYVDHTSAHELLEGDVIAFYSNNSIISHRVVNNNKDLMELVTKGDANEAEDMNSVPYNRVIGKVVFHLPILGKFMVLYTSSIGKLYMICFAVSGALLNVLGSMMRKKQNEK